MSPRSLVFTALIVIVLQPRLADAQTMEWNNAGGGSWNTASNWTPANVPDSPGESALLSDTMGPTIDLNISPTIDWFNIDSASAVFNLNSYALTTSAGFTNAGLVRAWNGTATIGGPLTNLAGANIWLGASDGLNLSGPTFVNDGTVVVNYERSWNAVLTCTGDVSLSGSGEIVLNDDDTNARLNTSAGVTLTQTAEHTIRGYGQVNATLESAGLVHADVAAKTLKLMTEPKGNTGVFKAGGGGYLDVIGVAVTQADAGQILADAGTVRLRNGASVIGGTLASINGGALYNAAGSNTLNNVTLAGGTWFGITGSTGPLHMAGATITNDGTVVVNHDRSWSSILLVDNDVMLQGGGTVVMNDDGTNAQLNSAAEATLTQAAMHTISGRGQINADLINEGVVVADVPGAELELRANPKVNNNLMKAVSGAHLDLYGITVTQPPGGELLADGTGSAVRLYSGAAISGGSLTSLNDGAILNAAGTNTLDDVILTNGSWLGIAGSTGPLRLTGTAFTNDGTLVVNYNQTWSSALQADTDLTLQGSGQVVLNDDGTEAQLNTATGVTLEHAAGHTIRGYGQINAAMNSAGVVHADVSGKTLQLMTNPKGNTGTFKASGGGYLDIIGVAVTQEGAGQILADAGTVRLRNGASISSGTLACLNGGSMYNAEGNNTLNSPTLASGTWLGIAGSTGPLHMAGATITNHGTVVVNYNRTWSSTLLVDSDLTLQGGGTVVLNDDGSDSQLNTATDVTLTQASGHTVRGYGQIHAKLVSNGAVVADAPGGALELRTNAKTNNSVMKAAKGAYLDLYGITVTQAPAAQMLAQGGGIRMRGGATISGGTLTGIGAGAFYSYEGANTLDNVALSPGTWLGIRGGAGPLHLGGTTITNNGMLVVNYDQNWGSTLLVDNDLILQGDGEVLLNRDTTNAQLNTAEGVTLTQSAGHSVRGFGQINAALINEGLVDANRSGQILYLLGGAKSNNGVMRARNGGTLRLDVDADGTGDWLADGGTIAIQNNVQVITTGTITGRANGHIQMTAANNELHGSNLYLDPTGRLSANGVVALTGDLVFDMTDEAKWSWAAGSRLTMSADRGGAGCNTLSWACVEVGSTDNGTGGSGTNNFGLRQLDIADGAEIALTDYCDNANRSGGQPEALYAESLTIGADATLNLNGLHLYVGGVMIVPGAYGAGEVVDSPVYLAGDMNCDGHVDGDDVQPFVLALFDPDAYVAQYAGCDLCAGDLDADGDCDVDDAQPFVNRLVERQVP